MTYQETLAYLYAQLPMFQRIGKAAYKADLSNTHALMEITGHPERGLKCVHIAGTNGKGSTSHMIASVLQEAGLKVGLHTSPHLKDMRERFKINGEMIPESEVVRFVEEYRERFEPVNASFFEWGVALALHWFQEQQVDIAVLETGMGGRLDSTNVVMPEVSVITNIGWDHADFLGDTLEKIAGEKAGIIKSGVPVVIGDDQLELEYVFERAAQANGSAIVQVDHKQALPCPIGLQGEHQERNARTALMAIRELQRKGWKVDAEHIHKGLARVIENTGLSGRWQQLGREPMIVADVAHNRDGIKAVGAMLRSRHFEKLHIVIGTVNDKDLGLMLAELPQMATYYFCKADIPRGLDANSLQVQASAHGLQGERFNSVNAAYSAARKRAQPSDLILVTGSVFVVAEVL